MLLEFKELNQRLTRLDNNFPVEKSQEYLYAKCDFSNEFDGLNIACYVNGIVFQANANGLYEIPYEQIAYPSFNIYFVGTLDTKVITTGIISISVLKTGDLSGVPPISTQPLLMDTWYNNFQFAVDSQTNEIVLSMITKNNVLTTKRITIAGTCIGNTATSTEWATLNPVLKAGEVGFDTTTGIFKIGNGTSTWSNLPHFAPKTLEAYSWAEISTISEQGFASSYFKVGDEKNVTLSTGEMVTLVILGFSHDTKTAGGSAGITFGMKNLLGTTYPMNSSDTNSGGWTSSAMRSSTMATLLSQLPSDLRSYMKLVNKLTSAGSQSTTINTDSDKLFLLSEIEVFGTGTYSVAGEGTQYAYYRDIANTNALRIKKLSNGAGSASYWWLRSPRGNSSTWFCGVTNNGSAGSFYAHISRGVAFGFCI